jgi:hypothetical protein
VTLSNDRATLLRRFFGGLTEHAFCERLGVADPILVDYIAEMLVRFVQSDRVLGLQSPTGRRLDQVAEMLAEAQSRQGEARRHVHRHIGDFTLFWTGVYPEFVERVQREGGSDSLLNYGELGRRSYYVASTIPVEKEVAPTPLLKRLSDEFDLCVYGLGEVRREWERASRDGGSGLLIN